jgi:hypothetical protein
MPQTSKMLLGAVVAAALAFAVFYGLIGQQTATNIQTQADQALGTGPAAQQTATPNAQNPIAPMPTSSGSPTPRAAPAAGQ